jgi:hypothetical protein
VFRTFVGAWLAVLVALPAAAPAGRAAAPVRVRHTSGSVQSLDVDGVRVAFGLAATPSSCPRVLVWNASTGRAKKVSGKQTCRQNAGSTGSGLREVGIGGTRVAWTFNAGGNTESIDYLYASSTTKRRERRLATAFRSGDVDCVLEGRWLGGLVADGGFFAYSAWTTVARDQTTCAESVTSGALRQITGSGTERLAAGTDTVVSHAAGGRRVAVLRSGFVIALYSRTGRLLRTFPLAGVRDVALAGDRVVVLLGRTMAVYGAGTGRLIRTRSVAAGAASLDAFPGVAVYQVGRQVRAVSLVTGKDVRLALAPSEVVQVAVGAGGVAYAYNTTVKTGGRFRDVGNVVFRPTARVKAALS